MTPRWINYFMEMAHHAASISKDPSTAVGAVAVDSDKNAIATGFNGLPRGVADIPERMERPAKYLWTSHAEENLVATAARAGRSLSGARVFVTHYPCATCARLLIQAGVSELFVGDGKTSMPNEQFETSTMMFREAGVEVTMVEDVPIGSYANTAKRMKQMMDNDALTKEWK